MKKIIFANLLFCLSIATKAQGFAIIKKARYKIDYGVQASVLGAVANTLNSEKLYNNAYHNNSSKLGFRAGFILNMPLGKQLAFTPGLNYVNKGNKEITSYSLHFSPDESYNINQTISTSHIEIPLNFTFTTGGTKGVIIGLGPVISYGIGGSIKGKVIVIDNTGLSTTYSINNTVKFDGSTKNDGNTHYKAVEVGGNIMLGYKFSPKYSLSFLYNTTFTNSSLQQNVTTYKINYWGLNFGYSFF
jgi:hypothetical protein